MRVADDYRTGDPLNWPSMDRLIRTLLFLALVVTVLNLVFGWRWFGDQNANVMGAVTVLGLVYMAYRPEPQENKDSNVS